MQANPRTVDALFNAQLRYVVPMFQRLYVWKETPQWTTLWEDISEKAALRIAGTKSTPHYLGALITEGVRSVKGEVGRFLVIDGQQRLTTLQLLLCAFRDIARKHEWKKVDRATSRYLENADADVMEHPEEELLKVWPTKLNREVFRNIVLAGSRAAIEAKYPLVYVGRRRKPEPRSNLVEGYLYFSRTIDAWIIQAAEKTASSADDCALSLLQALQQDFCVVEIALSEGDDSQEIFYSLNSQGQPLSQSDLLRSLIFMRAEKERLNRDAIFDEYWSKFETDFWSTEIKRGGRSYARLDLGLRFFLMAKTGALVDARRVNEEYRRWISSGTPQYPSVRDELADFSLHSDVYQRYEAASQEHLTSTDLRRIFLDFDVSTAIPLVMYLELDAGLQTQQIAECLHVVESFVARRQITGEETKEHNKLFVEVIGSIRGISADKVKVALIQKLLSGGGTTRHWPTDEEVIEKAISRRIFSDMRTPALRLILERLELSLRTKKSEGTEISSGLQIEHVLPQRWATYWPLKGTAIPANVVEAPYLATGDLAEFQEPIRLRNGRLHTLGNLTLLNQYLNPAASNGSFETKLEEYRHSVLRLNRYFDGRTQWDEDSIRDRGKVLGEQICRIWPRASEVSQ